MQLLIYEKLQYIIQHIIYYYQTSKFFFSCVLLVESVSRATVEIRLSPSHQRAREGSIIQRNNKKEITCVNTRTRDLWTAQNRKCFVNRMEYRIKLTFFRKLIKYFIYFRMKFPFFHIFDFWYIIEYF